MTLGEEAAAILFSGVEGNIPHLIGAPDFARQRHDRPLPLLFHGAAVRENSIILPVVLLRPGKVDLRREEGRAKETRIHRERMVICLAVAYLLKAALHRHVYAAPQIGRFQDVAAHGKREAAQEADHADLFRPEDFQQLSDRQRRSQADLIVDEDLDLRLRAGKDFIDLDRIGTVGGKGEDLPCIPCRQSRALQGFYAEPEARLVRPAHEDGDLLHGKIRPRFALAPLQIGQQLFRRHRPAISRHMPLFFKQLPIPVQERIVSLRRFGVVASCREVFPERCTAEVVDERVPAKEQIIARLQDAQRIVVVLIIAGTEARVEEADLLQHLALEKIAEADERRPLLPAGGIWLVVCGGESLHILKTFVGHCDRLMMRAVVRDAAHGANLRTAVKSAAKIPEPVLRDDDIAVQEQQFRARRHFQPLIAALGEAHVLLVADADEPLLFFQPLGRTILGGIVDDDDLIRPCLRMLAHARNAELQQLQRVKAQNDDARLMVHVSLPAVP